MTESLTIVIPAYNEAESLKLLLPEMVEYCRSRGWKVILIDDGSSDNTYEVAREYLPGEDFKVLSHKVNRGYGGALKKGINFSETNLLITMDSDGQHRLTDIDRMLEIMVETDADMVIGRRKSIQGTSLLREMGKWVIRRFANYFSPQRIHDLNSGFKLYRTRIVQAYIDLCPDSMAFSDIITLVFISQKHKVVECPIAVNKRRLGKSTIGIGTGFETLAEILNIIMLFSPLRILFPISILCVSVGLLWGIPFLILGRGVSVGSMLGIVTGTLLFILGLLAEQLSLIRREKAIQIRKELDRQAEEDRDSHR